MQTTPLSWRVFLRIVAIVGLFGLVAMIIANSMVISRGNEQIQSNQLKTLTHFLISQAALSADTHIANDDQESLLRLTHQIASDRLVYDATIYDAAGTRLASSADQPVSEILGLDTPLNTASIGRVQLVEPINHDGNQIGFIRVTFEKGFITAISDHHYRNSDHLMYLMLFMSFLGGVLLTLLVLYRPKSNIENILLKDV